MRRIHILEFEDLPWFPSWLRTCVTNNIVVLARCLGVEHALGALVSDALRRGGLSQIIDLGSGAGGVLPDTLAAIGRMAGASEVSLLLSDKYPNDDAVKRFNGRAVMGVQYCEEPVDATKLEAAPAGLKTMVNCFHHMRPDQARAILRSAADQREPLLIYEMGGHQTVSPLLWLLTLPVALPVVFLTGMVMSAFVRPVTAKQLVFTYFIPVIPLFYAWDGWASTPRIYVEEDLDELLEGLEKVGYSWEKGYGVSKKGSRLGTYLLGLPDDESAAEAVGGEGPGSASSPTDAAADVVGA